MTDLRADYANRHTKALAPVATALVDNLTEVFAGIPRIDRVTARAKSIERFMSKAAKKDGDKLKYDDPLNQIQDQIGARIITFYSSDVPMIEEVILREFRPIESKHVVPQHQWEFGYFGRHHILLVPSDLYGVAEDKALVPDVFELQIKTLFQHAWSEAEHDLGYKPGEQPLDPEDERLLAFTSAQAWGADRIFDDLFKKGSTRG
jgi:ppGpp synthetase/RelA/SpoT-type nucleotidyltranferase